MATAKKPPVDQVQHLEQLLAWIRNVTNSETSSAEQLLGQVVDQDLRSSCQLDRINKHRFG